MDTNLSKYTPQDDKKPKVKFRNQHTKKETCVSQDHKKAKSQIQQPTYGKKELFFTLG